MFGLKDTIAEIDYFKGVEVDGFFLNKKILSSYVLCKPDRWIFKHTYRGGWWEAEGSPVARSLGLVCSLLGGHRSRREEVVLLGGCTPRRSHCQEVVSLEGHIPERSHCWEATGQGLGLTPGGRPGGRLHPKVPEFRPPGQQTPAWPGRDGAVEGDRALRVCPGSETPRMFSPSP